MNISRSGDRLGADDTLEAGAMGEEASLYEDDAAETEDVELWTDRESLSPKLVARDLD